MTVHREFTLSVLAPVLGAGGGESLPADFAVHPGPEPRVLVTAAGRSVFATVTGAPSVASAVDTAA